MNLIKWLRKNNTKVMAVVVIFIFIGFVGQAYFSQLSRRRTSQLKTIAYFADNRKITNYDLAMARQELEILKLIRADYILRSTGIMAFRTREMDLQAILLAELFFSDRTISPSLSNHIKQIIGESQYRISDKQINDIYKRSMPSEMYWLLLNNEAQLAGMKTSNEVTGATLAKIIPLIFNGATYSQIIGSITNQQSVSEEEILTTFGKLMAVLTYARAICSSEDITNSEIMHNASWEGEIINVEFVKFDSAVFAKSQKEPDEEELAEHFYKYKKFFAGDINDQNPYGFGYKLDDRVRLEYIAVKLNDVSKIVAAPTQEDVEEYYQKHKGEFTESIPSDPNDPNSQPIERVKSYGEVAATISKNLLQDKISSEAKKILQEARTLTEAGLQTTDTELAKISSEQFKQMVGNYVTAAKQLSEKYKIKVYTGRTGMLSASDILTDKYLRMLFVNGDNYNPVGLVRVVFAIDELATSELGPFDIPKPRLYENIGPSEDMLGRIMVVMRAIEAEKASVPESINLTFTKDSLELDESKEQPDEKVYSIREMVAEDLKKLAAMNTTKSKTEEFIRQAAKDGWEKTIDKFNKLYAQKDKQNGEDANAFELQNLTNLQRISSMEMETAVQQSAGNPMGRLLLSKIEMESQFVGQLYSLIPQDSNTIDNLPLIMEFKSGMSYYCLKNISVKRLEQEQYDKIKALLDYKEDFIQYQSLAAVYFNPENIIKRMKFRLVDEDKEKADFNTPSESEGEL
jgi:hypothetical protein